MKGGCWQRTAGTVAAMLLMTLAVAAQAPQLGRSVHGVVLDAMNRPIPGAIVYLKNVRTKVIHTAVTDGRGAYSFHRLEPNISYELYAVWKKQRSKARTASQYSSAEDLTLDLTIPIS